MAHLLSGKQVGRSTGNIPFNYVHASLDVGNGMADDGGDKGAKDEDEEGAEELHCEFSRWVV